MLEEVKKDDVSYKMYVDSDIEKNRFETFLEKEPETVAWIEEYFKDGETFLDVGANIGVYTLYAASLHKELKVYAVEPAFNNFYKLCHNIVANAFGDRVVPLAFGLGEKESYLVLRLSTIEDGSASHSLGGQESQKSAAEDSLSQLVAVTSLDKLVSEGVVVVPNHIKIDVDGTELQVVSGMREALSSSEVKSILIEVDHKLSDAEEIIGLIEGFGFTSDISINSMQGHSRERREAAGHGHIENIIFARI